MSFLTDLAVGREGEQKLISHLIGLGAVDIETRNDYWWDVKCTLCGEQRTFETKYDLAALRTGNAAVEIRSRGKASGICTSKSDYWVHIVGDKIYIMRTADLRYLILCNTFRKVSGGDDNLNEMVLIELHRLEEITCKIS